jgi:hypothetical protein
MQCQRCGKLLDGEDRVLVIGDRTLCGDCGRKKEPVIYTNGARALKGARKRALVTGFPVTITLVPDDERRRIRYYLKVRRPESFAPGA